MSDSTKDILDEIEWRYDKGQDLFHQDMQLLFEQAKKAEQYKGLLEFVYKYADERKELSVYLDNIAEHIKGSLIQIG